jgi:hypothetical protein
MIDRVAAAPGKGSGIGKCPDALYVLSLDRIGRMYPRISTGDCADLIGRGLQALRTREHEKAGSSLVRNFVRRRDR